MPQKVDVPQYLKLHMEAVQMPLVVRNIIIWNYTEGVSQIN